MGTLILTSLLEDLGRVSKGSQPNMGAFATLFNYLHGSG